MSVRDMVLHSLVVIDNLNVFGAISPFRPFEANTPLLADADAVLAFSVTGQHLQTVAGKLCKIPQVGCRFKNAQTLFSLVAESFEGRRSFALGEAVCSPVSVAPDHLPA